VERSGVRSAGCPMSLRSVPNLLRMAAKPPFMFPKSASPISEQVWKPALRMPLHSVSKEKFLMGNGIIVYVTISCECNFNNLCKNVVGLRDIG
jgi:hypothetical protein